MLLKEDLYKSRNSKIIRKNNFDFRFYEQRTGNED